MVWTEQKDIIMLTTIAAEGVFHWKLGSRERGKAWQAVAVSLNANTTQSFCVLARSIRDRFNILAKKVKSTLSKELKESGGGDEEQSELERLVEELVTLGEESDKRADDQSEAKKETMANEKKQAIEMRERALERFGETRKRNDDEQEAEKKTT